MLQSDAKKPSVAHAGLAVRGARLPGARPLSPRVGLNGRLSGAKKAERVPGGYMDESFG